MRYRLRPGRGIGEITDASAVTEMVEHLFELGHRPFLHAAGNLQFASARAKKATCLEKVERLGLDLAGVLDGDWSGESGRAAMLSLADERMPTAVIAANDVVAAGVVRGARGTRAGRPARPQRHRLGRPRDRPLHAPSLTTVEVDLEGLGRNAMVRLVKAVANRDLEPSRRPLNRVIWRESTAGA